jgi:hypothetical protein
MLHTVAVFYQQRVTGIKPADSVGFQGIGGA